MSSRIFAPENFNKLITDPATQEAAALAADEKIKAEGVVLYGTITESGKHINFTNQQKENDTHKIMGFGKKALALFAEPDLDESVATESPTIDQENQALRDQVRMLKGELSIARGRNGQQ